MELHDHEPTPFDNLLQEADTADDFAFVEEVSQDPILADDWARIDALPEDDEDEPAGEDPSLIAALYEESLDPHESLEIAPHPLPEPLPVVLNTGDDHEEEAEDAAEVQKIHVAARRARQTAHSAHSLTAADVKAKFDEMSVPLSVSSRMSPGQRLFISFTVRSLSGFQEEAKAYIREIVTGTVAEKQTSRWVSGAKFVWWAFNYFMARVFEEAPPVRPVRPGREDKVRPMKEMDEDEKQALKDAQEKANAVGHFEVDLYIGAIGEEHDKAELEGLADDLAMAMIDTFHTTIQGLTFDRAQGIEALQGYSGRKTAKPPRRVVFSSNELALMAAPCDDTTTPSAGVSVDRAEVRQIEPRYPMLVADPLHPPKGVIPVGLVRPGTTREMTLGISNRLLNRHMFYTGGTGTGKTEFMKRLAFGIAKDNSPLVVIDPHGKAAGEILDILVKHCPERIDDIVLCDLSDADYPIAINPLDVKASWEVDGRASSLEQMLRNEGEVASAPRAMNMANAALMALMEANTRITDPRKKATLLDLVWFFQDQELRNAVVNICPRKRENVFQLFAPDTGLWDKIGEKEQASATSPIIRAVNRLTSHQSFARVFSSPENKLDFGKLIGERKIVLLKMAAFLDQQPVGEFVAGLTVPWMLESMSEWGEWQPEGKAPGPGCRLLIDEAKVVIKPGSPVVKVLAEARKWNFGMIATAQMLNQLPQDVVVELLGNTSTKASFQVDSSQAKIIANSITRRDTPVTDADISEQESFHFFMKTLSSSEQSDVFSAFSLPPLDATLNAEDKKAIERVKDNSRRLLSNRASDIDAIRETHLDDLKAAVLRVIQDDESRGARPSGNEFGGIDWDADTGNGSPWKRS
jgi:hypothetical protein